MDLLDRVEEKDKPTEEMMVRRCGRQNNGEPGSERWRLGKNLA